MVNKAILIEELSRLISEERQREADYRAKMRNLVRDAASAYVLTEEDKIQRKRFLDRDISPEVFNNYFITQLWKHLLTHRNFADILKAAHEFENIFGKTSGPVQSDILDRKIMVFLQSYTFEKMMEFVFLYRGSYNGKPMTTKELLQ